MLTNQVLKIRVKASNRVISFGMVLLMEFMGVLLPAKHGWLLVDYVCKVKELDNISLEMPDTLTEFPTFT